MSEFKLYDIVNALLTSLGGRTSKVTPEKLVEYLQESQSVNTAGCQVVIQKHLTRLCQDIPDSDHFLLKYNDLKDKNVDSLDAYVQLLDYISQDASLKDFLQKSKPSPSIRTEFTKDDLPQVRNRLKKAVTKKSNKDDSLKGMLNISSSIPLATTPSVISWVQRRPNMSWDFSIHNISHSIPTVPVVSQENILIEDLLSVLIGLPGCYIEPEDLKDVYGPRTFKINDNIPLSLRELVKQILPLASHYSIIQRFTEEKMRFEFGQVNNALAEAMQGITKEHLLFTIQLETEFRSENLTLQKLWFYVQRNMQSLGITAAIASSISKSDAKGGKVLSLLHDNVIGSIGDERTQQLCLKLMEAACVPYMKMLGMWIYKGIISDPISEFLVEDNEVVQREDMPVDYSADYWEKKYAVRRERIPKFLESVADIILKAGKYLNVIRQCGKPVKNKVLPIQYKIEEKHYIEAIEKAYMFASQTLLNLVVKEKDLIGRLKSVKYYFLLEKGDFIVTFLTLCEKELGKFSIDVNQGSIESLMDLALRLSSAISDPYKEDLRTELLQYDLQFQMFKILSIQTRSEQDYWSNSGSKKPLMIESFSFSYEVHWPLSLILNRKSLACYQMIFRHLFFCKYIERMICQVWKSNKVAKKFHFEDAKHYRIAFALRQRMLHCIQNLEYHMMVEVIEPHWSTFLQRIGKVNNVDEILSCHCDFLNNCLKDCMLTIPEILSTIIKLLIICEEFCKFMQQMQRYFVEAELGSLPNSFYESFTQSELVFQGNNPNPNEPAPSFKEKISLYDTEFSAALMKLLDQINDLNRETSEHDRLFNLLYRILALCPSIDGQHYLPFNPC
ncbi:gamma-tubulin complex component 2 isoform X2 [Leptinotarsa decemlineata]|uniref:gamma-tubulin complex component 2 isoform X2 n=1 Tax=Leptinotarsa decemlineata TaxID=7539 RepID=UPI003D30999C